MRFYDGVVAVVVGVVATSLAGCGGDTATTTTLAPSPGPSPPGPSPPGPSPLPTVTTPDVTGVTVPEVPDVTCTDTSLNDTLEGNLSCTKEMNTTSDTCCGAVVGWGANVDVLVTCEGENAATDEEKEQIYRARCMCSGGNQWEEQLKELSTVNMTACTHSFHPLPGAPAVDLPDTACACGVIADAQTALKASAADNCEPYVNGAIDTFGWGTLRAACEATSELSVESDVSSQTETSSSFPWALVAAAGVVGLSVMVAFRMKARATAQSSDVTELGASC